jgi:hypothetical protein
MQSYLNPAFVIYGTIVIIIRIICFAGNTLVKVVENGKEIEKEIKDVKKDEMVLVHNGYEKRYAKVLDNKKSEGEFEFFVIKAKNVKDPSKTKEVTITPEHIMITFDDKKEIKLVVAKDLKGDEIIDTEEGFHQIYEIEKKKLKDKYMLSVKGGCVFANGIFISTICSGDNAKDLKPTLEEWKKLQRE